MTMKLTYMAASLLCFAAIMFGAVCVPRSAGAQSLASEIDNSDILAAELLVLQGDLLRLEAGDALPPNHIQGIQDRIVGALGLLPNLFRQKKSNIPEFLMLWNRDSLSDPAYRRFLIEALGKLIKSYPLHMSGIRPNAKDRREARAIHQAYCAGCHDNAGDGDLDDRLPARDLFKMAHEQLPQFMLARLVVGVKGDETLLFSNPLRKAQLKALLALYLSKSS